MIMLPKTGWLQVVLLPVMRMTSDWLASCMELVIAPEPSVVARPATVEL